jgi:Rps23 Pro-64 3,4-dihydroxylase Tpa1-like proline 4-hydroxylase
MITHTDPKQFTKIFCDRKPYPYIQVEKFFDAEIFAGLTHAVGKLEFTQKSSDLFEFYQTSDLASITEPTLTAFKEYLYSKTFVTYIEEMTNTQLSTKADLFVSIYQDTNYLLPHDDKIGTRKIAFLVYLEDFSEDEGGALEIWDNDGEEPTQIADKIIPKANSMVLFKVSEKSFHAVEEVVVDKQRIAITGWYHAR